MRLKRFYIIIALGISLFIYVFYRTEKTVINELLTYFMAEENIQFLRGVIKRDLLLNSFVIYSLPGGLWVFCLTLLSRIMKFKVGKLSVGLGWFPLVFSLVHEFLQWTNIIQGRFDIIDLLSYIVFWTLGYFISSSKGEVPSSNIKKQLSFVLLFSIVYLAHVSS